MEAGSSSSSVSNKVEFSTLSDVNKSNVWLLLSKEDGGHFTGFGVDSSGLVMSCTHGWCHLKTTEFIGRRLDKKQFYKATLVDSNKSYDLSLFHIEDIKPSEFGVAKLAIDGSLDGGCPVFTIGNPAYITASFSPGFVSYPCVENVVGIPLADEKCIDYVLESPTQSISHRVFGHIYHSTFLKKTIEIIRRMNDSPNKVSLERLFHFHCNLNPRVAIVQCNGITICPGASGAPLFNPKGEVVGLIVSEALDFQIAVHVSTLRHFLSSYLDKSKRLS